MTLLNQLAIGNIHIELEHMVILFVCFFFQPLYHGSPRALMFLKEALESRFIVFLFSVIRNK